MRPKLVDRLVAGAVFAYALVLYLLTVAPTASFWDAGEYIAVVNQLEVSHPPGAPFYMLLGRLFSMFVPAEYVALSVNLVSVFASAGAVLLGHLVIVRLVRMWQRGEGVPPRPLGEVSGLERAVALVGGAVGACTFAATDSFWFNAVEAEVYALSMFFTAAVVWLVVRWADAAAREEALLNKRGTHLFGLASNRYLVLIAYLFGLAIGIHLLNLLALFFVALIIFFAEYDRPDWDEGERIVGLLLAAAAASAAFLFVYPGVIQVLPTLAGASGFPFVFFILVFAVLAFALWFTHTRGMQRTNLLALCATMILIGYSAYALIVIRSAADPPIDENDPETGEAFISYLKREQYGSTPLLTGRSFENDRRVRGGRIGALSEEEKFFPRRYSPQGSHQEVYRQYGSDFSFFWGYQVGEMYVRYFLWNFMGRESDVQGADAVFGPRMAADAQEASLQTPSERSSRNYYFALPLLLGLFGMAFHFARDWRRAFSVAVLFLLTGLGIIVYLNQTPLQPRERDYSYVGSFFAFSLWVGIGAAGLLELAGHALRERFRSDAADGGGPGGLGGARGRGALFALSGLLFLAVPGWMVFQNYDDHDRSGRYIAPDYAYNMLNSVAQDAILFTNGDNDTFPLWYLQEVEGVRRDVRVVNLSLLNTPWYIKQLKNQSSHSSAPIPMDLSDEDIETIGNWSYQDLLWQPDTVRVPVDASAFREDTDLASLRRNRIEAPMEWVLRGRPSQVPDYRLLITADRVAYNILRTNAEQGWERPIYFATTSSRQGRLDLQPYFQLEGLALRVVPIRHNQPFGRVTPVTAQRMSNFRFRGLDDPDVYYDSVTRRLIDAYRLWFSEAAFQLADKGRTDLARPLVERLSENVPFDIIASDTQLRQRMVEAHAATGDTTRALTLLRETEERAGRGARLTLARSYLRLGEPQEALRLANDVKGGILGTLSNLGASQNAPGVSQETARRVQALRRIYVQAGAYEEGAAFSRALAEAVNTPGLAQSAEEIRRAAEGLLPSGAAPSAPAPSSPDSAAPPVAPAEDPELPGDEIPQGE